MADNALADPWYGLVPEDMLMDDVPDDTAEGFSLWEEAPQQTMMSNARRIGMYRDENPSLMALFMQIICSWEMGQPLEDPPAFDGNPAQQDGGYEPGEKGAAYVEVRGATGAVAASVRKTNKVTPSPGPLTLTFSCCFSHSHASNLKHDARAERSDMEHQPSQHAAH